MTGDIDALDRSIVRTNGAAIEVDTDLVAGTAILAIALVIGLATACHYGMTIDEFNTDSSWLNLYLYPEAADYARVEPLAATWHRLNSTVRTNEAPFDVEEHLPGDGKVVYLSLGSLGCMDLGLMQRLIDAMATTKHRTIVSMGPLKDQMHLGGNMYGDQFLPQPSILPQCDLLITHGVLHLLGYDHDSEEAAAAMRSREEAVCGRAGARAS